MLPDELPSLEPVGLLPEPDPSVVAPLLPVVVEVPVPIGASATVPPPPSDVW